MNARAIRKLFAGRITIEEMPTYGPVHGEAVYLLTKGTAVRIPPPPTMMNHGNWIVSVSELGRFLGEQAEAEQDAERNQAEIAEAVAAETAPCTPRRAGVRRVLQSGAASYCDVGGDGLGGHVSRST